MAADDEVQKVNQKKKKKSVEFKPKHWIWAISVLAACICAPLANYFWCGVDKIRYDRFVNPQQELERYEPVNNLFFVFLGVDSAVGIYAVMFLHLLILDLFGEEEISVPNQSASTISTKDSKWDLLAAIAPIMILVTVVIVFIGFGITPTSLRKR
ncbi:OLC1v1028492C1 [Oldenlandia corymbosa var. corymbosa]|uniref:OLC1v1028492C1 n=1 Tax=Oldenlandia corymbosa var. corymbosa TaxID=529605 RepID=A0AAV1CDM5_OLDCO|nr:OLC1v1028492C1 [Oldenlandia corymbosa var. corymbosa]